jgi:hypothetical protein
MISIIYIVFKNLKFVGGGGGGGGKKNLNLLFVCLRKMLDKSTFQDLMKIIYKYNYLESVTNDLFKLLSRENPSGMVLKYH